MTETGDVALGRVDLGRAIGQAFALIGRNFPAFFTLALLFSGVPEFLASQAITLTPPDQQGWVSIAAPIVSFITPFILQGAVTRLAIDDLAGGKKSFRSALVDGVMYLPALLGVGILASIGIALGMLLLIVPGLILAVRWTVAAPVSIAEGVAPTRALGRSSELTEDHRWGIFAVFLLFFLVAFGLGAGGNLITGAIDLSDLDPQTMVIVLNAVSAALSALVTMVQTAMIASIYFELRRGKEGVGVAELARVFD